MITNHTTIEDFLGSYKKNYYALTYNEKYLIWTNTLKHFEESVKKNYKNKNNNIVLVNR